MELYEKKEGSLGRRSSYCLDTSDTGESSLQSILTPLLAKEVREEGSGLACHCIVCTCCKKEWCPHVMLCRACLLNSCTVADFMAIYSAI